MAGGVSHILTAVITWDQKKTKKLIYSNRGCGAEKNTPNSISHVDHQQQIVSKAKHIWHKHVPSVLHAIKIYMIDHWTVCSARSWPDCQSTSCKRRSRCPGSHLFGVGCAEISGLAYIYKWLGDISYYCEKNSNLFARETTSCMSLCMMPCTQHVYLEPCWYECI